MKIPVISIVENIRGTASTSGLLPTFIIGDVKFLLEVSENKEVIFSFQVHRIPELEPLLCNLGKPLASVSFSLLISP